MNEVKIKAWVARDDDDSLFLYYSKPSRLFNDGTWYLENFLTSFATSRLPNNLFPQVKWTDPEPTEVQLTIKIKEK